MKKHIFIAKQGLFFKIISIVLQCFTILPLSFLISFAVKYIALSFFDFDSKAMLKILMIVINIAWLVRNCFVKVDDNRIIWRDWIGEKKTIYLDNITSLRIISYKELRQMVFKSSGIDPLISNCCALIIPMGNFITFKNKYGRNVVVGVWENQNLYSLLKDKKFEEVDSFSENEIMPPAKEEFNEGKLYHFFLKMPLHAYIATYFKHFYETILLPLFLVVLSAMLFKNASISVPLIVWILFFVIISALIFIKVIRVVVDTRANVIKLNLFADNNRNVLHYSELSNLRFACAVDEIKNNTSSQIVCTPYSKSNFEDVILFDTNNISVALSIYNSQLLYSVLNGD